jgi:hypothetical protein
VFVFVVCSCVLCLLYLKLGQTLGSLPVPSGFKFAFLEPRRLLERLENSWQSQATSLLTRDSAIANNVVGFLIALASVFAWFGVFAAHRSAAKLAILANRFRFGLALG